MSDLDLHSLALRAQDLAQIDQRFSAQVLALIQRLREAEADTQAARQDAADWRKAYEDDERLEAVEARLVQADADKENLQGALTTLRTAAKEFWDASVEASKPLNPKQAVIVMHRWAKAGERLKQLTAGAISVVRN